MVFLVEDQTDNWPPPNVRGAGVIDQMAVVIAIFFREWRRLMHD